MRFHFAAGTNCQQAFQLMTLVKVCKAGLVICDYNIDNDVYDEDDGDNHGNDGDGDDDDGDDQSKGEQCACHMQGEQH